MRQSTGRVVTGGVAVRGIRDRPYNQFWRIQKAFRMSKHDLAARPTTAPVTPMEAR